mmetsp:Transcript_25763/g.43975  ORF Transcript_25763/g.43975 Transcript_25763/m.43975 type:complete len:109 (-) Transcript_25763:236-562(-)
MFSSAMIKCCIAAILLVAHTSAFAPMIIPIVKQEGMNSEQGKMAGIGGLNGPKPTTSGGIGLFNVPGSKSPSAAPKKNAKKAAPKKTTKSAGEEKKKPSFFIKTPWSK